MSRDPSPGLLGRVAGTARQHLPGSALRVLRDGRRALRELSGSRPRLAPESFVDVVDSVRRGAGATIVVVMSGPDVVTLRRSPGAVGRVRRRSRRPPPPPPAGAPSPHGAPPAPGAPGARAEPDRTGPEEVTTRQLAPQADARGPEVVSGRVVLDVGDPPALVRLASSGLLSGTVHSLRVTVRWAPAWLRAGAPGIRPELSATAIVVRTRGSGLEVALSWSRAVPVASALDTVLRSVLRTRTTPRHDGPLPALDRAGWTAGAWSWPDGLLLDERPPPASAGPGPLAPFTDPVDAVGGRQPDDPPSLVLAVALPWRRKLLGEPAAYTLNRRPASTGAAAAAPTATPDPGPPVTVPGSVRAAVPGRSVGRSRPLVVRGAREIAVFDASSSVEKVVAGPDLVKYATLQIGDDADLTADDDAALLALAAVGVVPVPVGAQARSRLVALGLPFPAAAAEVRGVEGYAWSIAVSRAAAVNADPVLRRHLGPFAGGSRPGGSRASGSARPGGGVRSGGSARTSGGGLALPTVSVVIASMRPDTVPAVLGDLEDQTWPDFEVLLGTHGWSADPAEVDVWSRRSGHPLRTVAADARTPFGELLGRLSRAADGDLITKVDDDDVYGPDHLTDLVLALRSSGADLVSKAPRFVHLSAGGADPRGGQTGTTVDRSWAASEVLDQTPAGGTLLFARSTLLDAGGWSGSLRHVDIDVTARIRRAGGVTFRSHGLGYVYVRHDLGHTWEADRSVFLEQAGDVYEGLPAALATGRPAALRDPTALRDPAAIRDRAALATGRPAPRQPDRSAGSGGTS